MPEIKQATRKTENPYVNLYELETKDRVGHDKHYYVASRAKTDVYKRQGRRKGTELSALAKSTSAMRTAYSVA